MWIRSVVPKQSELFKSEKINIRKGRAPPEMSVPWKTFFVFTRSLAASEGNARVCGVFTWPLWKVPQEPASADELITLRCPKSKSSAWVVWHGCVTCSNPFPAWPGFALLCSPALCCCIYWAFLNDKIELIFRPLWLLLKNWFLLSGSGLCCSVSHLDYLIGYFL